jgi:hypothetical protein
VIPRSLQYRIQNAISSKIAKLNTFFFFFFFLVVLGLELRTSTLSHSTSPFFVCWVFFEIGSHKLFAQAGFEK